RIRGPVRRQHLATAGWRALVPQIDVMVGNGVNVGHEALLRLRRIDRLTDYRKSLRANRLPRRSRISTLQVLCSAAPAMGAQRIEEASHFCGNELAGRQQRMNVERLADMIGEDSPQ